MPAFRKALLLYNPISGGQIERRPAVVRRIAEIFRRAGVETRLEATRARGSAGEQARQGIASGFDAVVACGGDGTAFEVLQGVAETKAVMGVIPLGTGNVLARDLGLGGRPERAAAHLLRFTPQRISLGRIHSLGRSRYFTVAAGVGVHAELIYRASARAKQRGGYLAYYSQGIRLLFRQPFVAFPVEITTAAGEVIQTTTLELVAMRVRSFGGPLRYWRPGSSLLSPELRLVLLRNPSRAHILRYTLAALTGQASYDGLDKADADFSFVSAQSVRCLAPAARSAELRVQADGEVMGPAPVELSIVPDALTLLMPAQGESAAPQAGG
jgi:diacylglycerol kinase (ATP)